jgi:tetratricopeptide (TPR) repeat protein
MNQRHQHEQALSEVVAKKAVRRHRLAFAAATAVAASSIIGFALTTRLFLAERQAHRLAVALEQSQSQLRQQAESEAAKSRQVIQFLKDMLQGASPWVELGRDTKMLREISDKAAERVGRDLTNQPLLEAELRNTLGEVYWALGDYAKAETMERAALALRRKLLGNGHAEVAQSLNDLGKALWSQGKLSEAENIHREGLALRKKLATPGPIAESLNNLGLVLYSQGKAAEAEAMSREAVAIRRTLLDHRAVAESLGGLAAALWSQRKTAEAETVQREALTLYRKLVGDEHPEVATSLNNLALVLWRQGKLEEAEPMFREALAIKRKLQGEHQDVASVINNLAFVLWKKGQLAEAESLNREALAMRKKVMGEENTEVAASLDNLSTVLRDEGKLEEAEAAIRECLAIRVKKMPEDWRTFSARATLGGILASQKKWSEAEPLLVTGYEGMKQRQGKIPAEHQSRVNEAVERLVQLCEATGREPEAAEWKKKLAGL